MTEAGASAARFYGRPSLHVAVYDEWHAEVPGGDDIGFFRSLAETTGGPVLELGCGTGRVAIPLAEAGFEVVGLDLSTAMLDLARARAARLPAEVRNRLRFVEGDMRTTVVGAGFGLVFAAFRVFMALLDPEAQLEALRTIRGQLRPDGLLAIDLFDPRYDLLVDQVRTTPQDRGTYAIPGTARRVRITVVRRENDHLAQQLFETWTFEELDADGLLLTTEVETLRLRWTFASEMRHLLQRAGFQSVACYGDYARSAPIYAGEQVWVARPIGP